MRIIAGMAKGRNLNSPIGDTRPTSDRAREALFSTLESELGALNDKYFLDLYSGSGAVSAEALSRGAALTHAVENEESALQILRSNLELFEKIVGSGTYQVFNSSVARFLKTNINIKYDAIFIDPPYEFANELVTVDLELLLENKLLKSNSIIAVERDSKSKPFLWPSGITELKVRKYGHAVIYYGFPSQNG
ncbi:DNA methylase [Actinomycetes bacterium]|nr:DNA methylase [Actinomycetes bacterium]